MFDPTMKKKKKKKKSPLDLDGLEDDSVSQEKDEVSKTNDVEKPQGKGKKWSPILTEITEWHFYR